MAGLVRARHGSACACDHLVRDSTTTTASNAREPSADGGNGVIQIGLDGRSREPKREGCTLLGELCSYVIEGVTQRQQRGQDALDDSRVRMSRSGSESATSEAGKRPHAQGGSCGTA